MSKAMFRVYYRDTYSNKSRDKKWSLIAAFVYQHDAEWFISDKRNSDPEGQYSYKIMQGNRNIKVYND